MKLASLLTDIAACLKVTLEDAEVGDLCFIGVVPGDGVIDQYGFGCDDDRCGMAWVRLITAYPANGVGNIEVRPIRDTEVGFDVEVGIMRCYSVGNDQGEPPTPEEVLASSNQQADDALLMVKAIRCCVELNAHDWRLGSYYPVGPMGMLVGGGWNLSGVM